MLQIFLYLIYMLYTKNSVSGREREQGRFERTNEGAKGSIKGALREHGGAMREQ